MAEKMPLWKIIIGKIRAILNAGAAAGFWPSKGQGPNIPPK